MIALLLSIFKALAAIPAILGYVEDFAAGVALWYCQRQTNETLSQIADAAAFASVAKTDDERYEASEKWHDALGRDRITRS